MDLKEYFDSLDAAEKRRLAKKLGTSVPYLSQLANGHRRASPTMARQLVDKSGQILTLAAIRPDLWGDNAAA